MTFSQSTIFTVAVSALVLQGSACDRPGSGQGPASGVLARVDDEVVTVDEFKDALGRRARKHPRIYTGAGSRERLLRHLVDEEVIFAQALEEGYDKDPQIVREMRRRLVNEYLERNLTPVLDAVTVSDEDVVRHYSQNIDTYRTRELARAAVISVRIPSGTDESGRSVLLERARVALEEARKLPSEVSGLGELARRYSDDSKTKKAGGDIGWIVREPGGVGLDPALRAGILQLEKPGDLTPVIKTQKAFYISRLMELRPSQLRPLSDVRSAVRLILRNKARDAAQDEFYRKLRAGRKITLQLDLLGEVEVAEEKFAAPLKTVDAEAGVEAEASSPGTIRRVAEKPGASE